ncbi:MAG TPA: histidinol-phosphate transaminase [Planctomycetaceae bacterium]|nr:histidinol-phosphate transaminase [Planctomycetaceae bacterium]
MSLFRPAIDRIDGYIPGEQPQETGWIKLNTNENPYPPSPKVVEAIRAAALGALNLYPDPLATKFRAAAAPRFGVEPDWLLPANGSDENLTLILRSFIDPGQLVAYLYPSYILYETLADIQGGSHERLMLNDDWSWDFEACRPIIERARLVIIPNPNSPSGTRWSDDDILELVPPQGLLILDEAYGDFCDRPHRAELLKRPGGERIIITRSLSKSYSLAGVRLGFAIAHPELIYGMLKVKDSYNCDSLALAAGIAALDDEAWMEDNASRVRQTRRRLADELSRLGFTVAPSQSNFVWATHEIRPHKDIYEALKERKILVRYMRFPDVAWAAERLLTGLRISVGTDRQIDEFLSALREII